MRTVYRGLHRILQGYKDEKRGATVIALQSKISMFIVMQLLNYLNRSPYHLPTTLFLDRFYPLGIRCPCYWRVSYNPDPCHGYRQPVRYFGLATSRF